MKAGCRAGTAIAARAAKPDGKSADKAEAPARPGMTKAMENYLELHRHAAVRLALLANPRHRVAACLSLTPWHRPATGR